MNRISMHRKKDTLVIAITAPKNWFLVGLFFILVIGWLWGSLRMIFNTLLVEDFTFQSLNNGRIPAWLIFGLAFGYMLSWIMAGKEVLTITEDNIKLERKIPGINSSRVIPLERIRNLRISSFHGPSISLGYSLEKWGIAGGKIAFEDKKERRTFNFGIGISHDEAQDIIEKIETRLPG